MVYLKLRTENNAQVGPHRCQPFIEPHNQHSRGNRRARFRMCLLGSTPSFPSKACFRGTSSRGRTVLYSLWSLWQWWGHVIPTPASGTQQDTDQQLKSVKLPRTSKSSRGPEEAPVGVCDSNLGALGRRCLWLCTEMKLLGLTKYPPNITFLVHTS